MAPARRTTLGAFERMIRLPVELLARMYGCLTPAYLKGLNAEQRSAVEHGVAGYGANLGGPLSVIASAGSAKTVTLAHRVAHLIVNGADPERILLLTFSRRAAPLQTEPLKGIAPDSAPAKA